MSRQQTLYEWGSTAVHRSQPRLQQLWRRAVLRRGVDITAESAKRSCLVVAPHPDDETLGCGATIARKRAAGTPVTVLIAADGRYAQHRSTVMSAEELGRVRAAEAVEACKALGVAESDVLQLGYEDLNLERSFTTLVDQLRQIIADRQPEEILVVSGQDHHVDHRTLNRALHAALPSPVPCHVAEFPVWFWADGPWTELSRRGFGDKLVHFVSAPVSTWLGARVELVSTEGFLDAKRTAIAAHSSQTTRLTGEPEWAVMDAAFLAEFLLPYEPFFLPPSPTTSR